MLHGTELFQGLVERIRQKTQIFIPAGKCNRCIGYLNNLIKLAGWEKIIQKSIDFAFCAGL